MAFAGELFVRLMVAAHYAKVAMRFVLPMFFLSHHTAHPQSCQRIITYIPVKDKSAQLKKLKELMNRDDVECVINGYDAGRENIFRLVYEYAKCKKPLKRLWIPSMEDAAIKAGFDSLKDGAEYDNLTKSKTQHRAALARSTPLCCSYRMQQTERGQAKAKHFFAFA